MPFIGQPPFVVNGLGENGIGDLTASFFFSQRTNSKFTWGVGPASGWVDMAASMYIRGAMSHTHPMLRSVLKSQYHASLAMLREAVERCPPEEWESSSHKNAFWQVSYHTLFFAHLYLQRDEAAFRLWEQHRGEGDGIEGEPYSRAQVLEYWEFCDRMVDDAVDALDLDRTESGFSWYRMSKLEHQFVNIRHIQHHGAQLIDRVRSAADIGIGWVAAWPLDSR